jgi:hypothetical protein
MKKLALLVSTAVLSISGSAMAVAPVAGRTILIEGEFAGTAQFIGSRFLGPAANVFFPRGSCAYTLFWTSPRVGGDTLPCTVLEARTTSFPSCTVNRTTDINSTMFAGDGFTAFCSGFDADGFPFGPAVGTASAILILGESATGDPTLSGTFQDPRFPFFFESITIA